MEQERRVAWRLSLVAGELVLGVVRRVFHALPASAQRRVESRFFGSVFQATRVTNDAYGWRPDVPGGGEPPPGYNLPSSGTERR